MIKNILAGFIVLFVLSQAAFAEQKTYVVAIDPIYPPMEYRDEGGRIIGYAIDYLTEVAREAGFRVTFMAVPWNGIFSGLQNGQYDIVASSVTITPSRKKMVDFSEPYYEVRQALLTLQKRNLKTLDDMHHKRVGVEKNTVSFQAVEREKRITPVEYEEISYALAALETGRIDGIICDDVVAKNYLAVRPEKKEILRLSQIFIVDEPDYYGFVVKKGNSGLLELLNKGIKAVQDKEIDSQLRQIWIDDI